MAPKIARGGLGDNAAGCLGSTRSLAATGRSGKFDGDSQYRRTT
jgi:hypothetical protein